MTQNQTISEEKRQEILQRLRNRRGEVRRTDVNLRITDEPSDPSMSRFLRLRDLQADVARGVDVSQQELELGQDEELIRELLRSRKTRRSRKTGANHLPTDTEQQNSQAAELGQEEKVLEIFQQIREARRAKRLRINQLQTDLQQNDPPLPGVGRKRQRRIERENVSSTDFVRNIQQLLGSTENDLSSIPISELVQRRQDLQYRYDWMRSILEEMREELDRIQEHLINKLQAGIQTQEDSQQE
ncbi:hypothetical protein H6F61_12065 [Cyanobacteria bacterium FACHB-472]|nr:hypothetical protein [Cyanobacteria bacterium FACHB-472]